MNPLRVMIVDDTIVYRKIVSDVLAKIPGVEIVGTANNGKIAMSRIASLKPDLITLDIEMPEMNGLEVLARIQKESPDIGAIMLSTLTSQGSDMTIKALELGAFDFIQKPETGTMAENVEKVKSALEPMISAFKRRRQIKSILKGKISKTKPLPSRKPAGDVAARMTRITGRIKKSKSEIIAIGISTGGPNALARMMPMLAGDIGVPILIVQHMPPLFTKSLAKSLDSKCALEVKEAENGDILKPNTALIAPGGKQMKIVAGGDGTSRIVKITDDPPENSCKPSADYLFRSVASHYVGRATGVIMTGMGYDGNAGLRIMKENGAHIIAQDEATCTVFGMPKEPVESGTADTVAPLDMIAAEITKTVK